MSPIPKIVKFLLAGGLAFAAATPSAAYDWGGVRAHVTVIELSYLPGLIQFQVDTAVGNCPAGVWLQYSAHGSDSVTQAASGQSTLAGLLTAKAAGGAIMLFGNNGTGGQFCGVTNIWVL